MDVEFVIKIICAHSFSLHLKDVEQTCGISPHWTGSNQRTAPMFTNFPPGSARWSSTSVERTSVSATMLPPRQEKRRRSRIFQPKKANVLQQWRVFFTLICLLITSGSEFTLFTPTLHRFARESRRWVFKSSWPTTQPSIFQSIKAHTALKPQVYEDLLKSWCCWSSQGWAKCWTNVGISARWHTVDGRNPAPVDR